LVAGGTAFGSGFSGTLAVATPPAIAPIRRRRKICSAISVALTSPRRRRCEGEMPNQ
jgi:hypothetical protein